MSAAAAADVDSVTGAAAVEETLAAFFFSFLAFFSSFFCSFFSFLARFLASMACL